MACSGCGAAPADYFSTSGEPLCRVCHYAEQTRAQEQRAEQALQEDIPDALRDVGVRAVPKPPRVIKPGTMLRRGIVTLSIGAVASALWLAIVQDTKFGMILLAVTGMGFVMTVRGYKTRHYE